MLLVQQKPETLDGLSREQSRRRVRITGDPFQPEAGARHVTSFWIWAAVLAVLIYLLTPAGPTYFRRLPIGRIREYTSRLAIMRPGASLQAKHVRSGQSFSFLKGDDSGRIEQDVTFVLSERDWPGQDFEGIAGTLRAAAFVARTEVEGVAPTRVLRCTLTGRPISMPTLSGELIARIVPALEFREDDLFTLRLAGVENYAIWRRMNAGSFHEMASNSPSWLTRAFGKYQLKKLDSDKRKPPGSAG